MTISQAVIVPVALVLVRLVYGEIEALARRVKALEERDDAHFTKRERTLEDE